MNTKILRVALLIAMTLTLIVLAAPTRPVTAGQPTCNAVVIAQKTACVRAQLARFKGGDYYTWTEMNDYGDGTMEVAFYFEPMCVHDPVPCRIATQCVLAKVDCKTRAAICL